MPPSYIRVRAVVWAYGRGQTDTQTRVTTIHFASSTTHAKCKYAFSNRVIDDWNLLPASCINCSTINTFKQHHLSSELESEAVKFKVWQL